MHPLVNTLLDLSDEARKALELLAKHDYSAESTEDPDTSLPLKLIPKTLKEIGEDVMRHCHPIITRDDNIPNMALLSKNNMDTFIHNLNATSDRDLAHQFQYIELEPIRRVAEQFEELHMEKEARQLHNVYEFAVSIRKSFNAAPFGVSRHELAPIINLPTYQPEELTQSERDLEDRYAIFKDIFNQGGFSTAQRHSLFKAFYAEKSNPDDEYPHLVIITAIIVLMTQPSIKRNIKGKFQTVCKTVLTSLGLPAERSKPYGLKSIKQNEKPSLYKYKAKAENLVFTAIGNTR